MSNKIGITDLIEAGLNASHLRSRAIANNVANITTPGYRRHDVKFEEILAQQLAQGKIKPDQLKAELFRPMTTPVGSDGNDVDLNAEVGQMVKNSARYKALMRVLNKVYRQMEMAIKTK
ncbi:MAG: flagellar basal body rod protein FlgB [Planctomycetota bacterium]|jgi:flagellar basal-body rod protein FlgB